MSVESLRARYGGRKDEAIRRAIRQEIDGGSDVLDAMVLTHRLLGRYRPGQPNKALAQAAHDALRQIYASMEQHIREAYQFGL